MQRLALIHVILSVFFITDVICAIQYVQRIKSIPTNESTEKNAVYYITWG